MIDLTPNLAVSDIKETIAFYRDILGFELVMAVPEDRSDFAPVLSEEKKYVYAQLKSGDAEVMIQEIGSIKEDVGDFFDKIGASVSLYMRMEDVDGFYEKLSGKVEVVKELETTWYGMREFYIKDNNGYILAFASQVQS